MADKQFIGKVFEKTFSNGGSIIKLTLNAEDIDNLCRTKEDVTIEVKKSQKGKWYAEISKYKPQHAEPSSGDDKDDLPF